ncbi:hypothetical protein Hanom_Chr07g00622281 [Helianthus anomalus]
MHHREICLSNWFFVLFVFFECEFVFWLIRMIKLWFKKIHIIASVQEHFNLAEVHQVVFFRTV